MLTFLMLIGCGDNATPQEAASPEAPALVSIKQLPVPQFARTGSPPVLTHEPPAQTDSACGYQIDARHLYALSNQRLSTMGDIGRVSPVVVLQEGKPLDAFATTRDFADQCAGAFNFGRNAVRFSPHSKTEPADVARAYTLALSERFPLSTPDGDAWWAYPGTQVDLAFPDDGGLAGQTIEIVVTAATPQGKVQAGPTLMVGEDKVLLEEGEDALTGRLSLTVPDGAWRASLVIPPDGPYMLLTSVSIHSGDEVRPMLPTSTEVGGSMVVSTGPSADLLSSVRFTTEPPELTIPGELTSTGEFLGRLEAPTLAEISGPSVRERIGINYSPLRIFEDGKALSQPNTSCRKVKKLGNGRYCHSHEVVLLSSSDNTAPLDNSRSYTLALSNERRFEGGWWLYPGDGLLGSTTDSPPPGATVRLVLTAQPISTDSSLTLTLRSGGTVLVEQTVPGATFATGPLVVPVTQDGPLGELVLELSAEGHLVLQGAAVEWDG